MALCKQLFAIFSISIFFSGCFNTSGRSREGIYPYDASRDRAYILEQTDRWHFWLIADESVGYKQSETLDTGMHPFVHVPVHFFMYYKDNKPVAFVSYYFEGPLFGKIQFVFVDEHYRRQGIAEKIILYALNNMHKEGVLAVEICTRLINTGARKLYEKMGFKPLYDTGKYIYLEYSW